MDPDGTTFGAAARRITMTPSPGLVSLGHFTVDVANRTVTRDGERIRLTPTEWRMVEVLLRKPGRLVTGPELLTAMRGDADKTEASYLRIYMQQLRRKLEPEPSRPRYLVTESGMGYRYQP